MFVITNVYEFVRKRVADSGDVEGVIPISDILQNEFSELFSLFFPRRVPSKPS